MSLNQDHINNTEELLAAVTEKRDPVRVLQKKHLLTCTTKSRPRKSAMVLGRRVRPHTNLRKSERSVLENDSITSQNHWMSGAVGSTPLYVATDFSRCSGMSGLPHT